MKDQTSEKSNISDFSKDEGTKVNVIPKLSEALMMMVPYKMRDLE